MPTKRKTNKTSSKRKSVHHVSSLPAAKSGNSNILLLGGILVILIIIGLAWVATSRGSSSPSTTSILQHPISQITGQTTPGTTTVLPTLQGGHPISLSALLSSISKAKAVPQFTAQYAGTVFTAVSTSNTTINGVIYAEYQRYNGSARSLTSISSPLAGTFNSMVYYFANGTSYSCFTNTTSAVTTCQRINDTYNASSFGLSPFLSALPTNYTGSLSELNSSYKGIPCTALLSTFTHALNNSGVLLNTSAAVSGCISLTYKIPLELNLSSFTRATGSYYNGTAFRKIIPQSQSIMITLRLLNLTNSSSGSMVLSLPANAVIAG